MEKGSCSGGPGGPGAPDAIPSLRSHPREVVMPFLFLARLSTQRLPFARSGFRPPGLRRAGRTLPGVVLFSGLLLGLPVTPHTMAQMQALNRELGKLCSNPPRQAMNVCRIHARLVDAL